MGRDFQKRRVFLTATVSLHQRQLLKRIVISFFTCSILMIHSLAGKTIMLRNNPQSGLNFSMTKMLGPLLLLQKGKDSLKLFPLGDHLLSSLFQQRNLLSPEFFRQGEHFLYPHHLLSQEFFQQGDPRPFSLKFFLQRCEEENHPLF